MHAKTEAVDVTMIFYFVFLIIFPSYLSSLSSFISSTVRDPRKVSLVLFFNIVIIHCEVAGVVRDVVQSFTCLTDISVYKMYLF